MSNGFLIPDIIDPQDTVCVVFKIPNDPLYRQAVRGHIWQLARWFEWEQTGSGDTRASQVAQLFMQYLLDTLQIQDDCLEAIEGLLPEGTILTTAEELQQAVCDGIMCAVPQIGSIMAAGANSDFDFTLDDDGNLIIDDGSTSDLIGSSQEQLYGAANYVHEKLLEFQQDYEDFFGAFPASEANAKQFFTAKYLLNASIDQAISDYYIHRQGMNPAPLPLTSDLANNFYCEGITGQTTTAFIVDEVVNDQLLLISMMGALTQDQYDQWAAIGVETPRIGFENTACYRYPSASITIDVNNWVTGFFLWYTLGATNHKFRMEIDVITPFTDASGNLYDGVYYVPDGQSPNTNFMTDVVNGGGTAVATNEPAYLAGSGKYVLEYNVTNELRGTFFRNIGFTPTGGEIRLTFIDLGAL